METYLFYAYLKYAKENKQSFWPKLLSRPISVIIFFSLTLLSCVCGAIFALLGWSIVALIGMVGEIVFGIIFYNCSEKYQIEFCVEEYDKYTEYCSNLHKWLEKFNKQRPDEIRELYDKIQTKIARMKTEEENSKARGDRWLQTLIIPAIIAIITAIITKQENIGEMITYAFAVVILFAVVYGIIAIIKSISFFPQKRRIEQMECFASDLQGVLDFINSNAKKKQ
jgi:hypothetical protein